MYKITFIIPNNKLNKKLKAKLRHFIIGLAEGYTYWNCQGYYFNNKDKSTLYSVVVKEKWQVVLMRFYIKQLNKLLKEECIYFETSQVDVSFIGGSETAALET